MVTLIKYYEKTDDANAADTFLVRSASMHDMELSESVYYCYHSQ